MGAMRAVIRSGLCAAFLVGQTFGAVPGRCPFYDLGTIPADASAQPQAGSDAAVNVLSKSDYHSKLKTLDIQELYKDIAELLTTSQECWPADGPQDGDSKNYAGLFGRLAWHCAGTFRLVDGVTAGGCEGGRIRYWPENQWRDNSNLDKARSLLAKIKNKYKDQISWGDLITFAGTVGIKHSGGPVSKFCFGRADDVDGNKSVEFGVEGVNGCTGKDCVKDICNNTFQWPGQDPADHSQCNLTQQGGRLQFSHSVGLIYVFPEGPRLNNSRSPEFSALEVRDTFKIRMGWTDRETVALIGGGHTLGRMHGSCDVSGKTYQGYAGEGPYFEAVEGSGRGPTDGTCGEKNSAVAGRGSHTITSGFDGPWTRTPSKWNYDYFKATLDETWEPVKSTFGNDQWQTKNRQSPFKNTRRLTADLALAFDDIYKPIAQEYRDNDTTFNQEWAAAWYKLMHRSANHPHENDLQKYGVCTDFKFLEKVNEEKAVNQEADGACRHFSGLLLLAAATIAAL